MPRPTEYSQEIAEAILARIAAGNSVRVITADLDMPAQSTVYYWLARNPDFREAYSQARAAAVDILAEEILTLGGEAATYNDKEGNVRIDTGDVQLRKLQADNLKWLMSKLAPKKYGDKLELGGSVGVRHEDALAALDDLAAGAADQGPASE